jgi:type I restriction enzyme S subunit
MGFEELNLPSHWDCKTLAECTSSGNVSYGIVQPGQFDPHGVGIIRVNNFQNDHLDVSDVLKVSTDIESKFSKTRLDGGEVLLTLVGSTGLSAVVPPELKGWNVARAVAVIQPGKEVSAEWINICLQSPYTKYFLDARANTTVQKTLNLKDVKEIPIPIPPKEERVRIEEILVSLNQKITLNRQINQTLEQMAQTLFKSWFVDFDPVIDNALDAGNAIPDTLQERAEQRRLLRAKADFKPLPAATRALFPSEFEETELGWVPKGWEVKNLGELVTVKRGGSPRPIQDFLVPEGLPWVKISDATASDSRFLSTTKEFIKPEGLNKTVLLQKGELILSNSATPGLPKFLELDACIHDGWLYFPEKRHISDLYLYQLFLEIRPLLVQQGNGSVFTNLKTDILKQHSMVVPTSNVLRSFEKQVFAFHSKIQQVNQENQNLQKIRDILLPQLISGELALDDLPEIPSP